MKHGCTYEGCAQPAEHDQVSRDGAVWARLCSKHSALRDNALMEGKAPAILREWIKCQGGSKRVAERAAGKP